MIDLFLWALGLGVVSIVCFWAAAEATYFAMYQRAPDQEENGARFIVPCSAGLVFALVVAWVIW